MHMKPATLIPALAAATRTACGALYIAGALAAIPATAAGETSAAELYRNGRYESAASRGLAELLAQPWNHKLRFMVADSLQRAGRIDEAKAQFEALEGTSYAKAAAERLQALRQPAAPGIALNQLPQFQLAAPEPGKAPVPDIGAMPGGDDGRSPAARRVAELGAAGKYQEAGSEGLALLAQEKPDEELRLVIANSLAWTGRLQEAIAVYQGLLGGKYASEASIGMANALRWRGRDDQALPLYRAVLAREPGNADAQEGLRLARRELRPRTTVSFGALKDSSDVRRQMATVNHRWRDANLADSYEIETSGVRDSQPGIEARQQDLTLRYQAPSLPLKPSVELGTANHAGQTLYGSVRVRLGDNDAVAELGRVNWGRIATNPNALQAGLRATHLGLNASQGFGFGTLSERLDYYDISDGNAIVAADARLASSWRPLGNHIKPFVGAEMRRAKFNTPNYWSPQDGFGSLYGGALAEWGAADWSFYSSAQAGLRLYGDAGTSWSLSAGGKRWIADDVGVGFNLWSMASQRNNVAYRAKSANVSLEKLW